LAAQESDNPDSLPADDQAAEDQDVEPTQLEGAPVLKGEIVPRPQVAQPMLRPQPGGARPSFVYFTSYTDYTARIQALMAALDQSFDRGDYLFAVDVNAYWKRRTQLDDIFDWVVSQIEKDPILSGRAPALVLQYDSIEDAAEDRDDEIRKKARYVGAVLGESGLALKEREKGFEPVPQERMQQIFRFVDWDRKPSEGELEKYGVTQIAAYFKENMIDLGLDVFLVIEAPRKIYPFGSGKSTIMLQVLGACATAMEIPFDIRWDVAYQMDYPRVQRFLNDDRKHQIRGVDEGKRIWSRRTPMSPKQRDDMQALSMTRKNEQVWATSCSNIFRLDHDIFEEKATHILRILDPGRVTIKRGWGRAILFEKGDHDEKADSWGNKRMGVEWVDLLPPPKTVYAKCISYTNAHSAEILEDGVSPLDRLLQKHAYTWADLLEGWPERDPIDWDPRVLESGDDEEDSARNSGD